MRTNRSLAFLAALTAALALTAGACTSDNRAWQYPPEPPGEILVTEGSETLPFKVAVPTLEDQRGGHNETPSYWLIALPFVPYTQHTLERPEALENPEFVDTIIFDPPRDLSKAIATELQQAGIFSSVVYTERGEATDADFLLDGTVSSTTWGRRATTYGFGGLGTVFWFLGAPLGTNTAALELDFRLVPADDPGRTLWSFRMRFNGQHVEGPYYGLEDSVLKYARALRRGLEVAVLDLGRLAKERPELFQRAQTLAQLTPRP